MRRVAVYHHRASGIDDEQIARRVLMLAKTPCKSFFWLALLWGLVAPSCLLAAESARDPTAAITAFQLMYRWNDFNGLPGSVDQQSFVLQPIIPWKLGNRPHIARITAPYVLSAPDWNAGTDNCSPDIPPPNYIPCSDKSGIGDIAAVDFFLFDTSVGRFGVGPVVVLPTGKDALGSGKWQLGPAGVFIGKTPKVVWGGLAQAFFSVAGDSDRDDVKSFVFNPIFSYDLGNNWAIGVSDMAFSYDFKTSQWTNVPIGIRLEKMMDWGKKGTRVFVDLEHNVKDSEISAGTTIRLVVVPLL